MAARDVFGRLTPAEGDVEIVVHSKIVVSFGLAQFERGFFAGRFDDWRFISIGFSCQSRRGGAGDIECLFAAMSWTGTRAAGIGSGGLCLRGALGLIAKTHNVPAAVDLVHAKIQSIVLGIRPNVRALQAGVKLVEVSTVADLG
jgi:hypothetical protein